METIHVIALLYVLTGASIMSYVAYKVGAPTSQDQWMIFGHISLKVIFCWLPMSILVFTDKLIKGKE